MATYSELYDIRGDSSLRNKIRVAITKKAQTLIDLASPTQAQLKWALVALSGPEAEAEKIFGYVLSANSSATVANIQNATDAAIQANVSSAVDKLLTIT